MVDWRQIIREDDIVYVNPPKFFGEKKSTVYPETDEYEKFIEGHRRMLRQILEARPMAIAYSFARSSSMAIHPNLGDVEDIVKESGYKLWFRSLMSGSDALYVWVRPDIVGRHGIEITGEKTWMDDQPHQYVMQHHYRGRSVHVDFRVKIGGRLYGWTLNDQRMGSIKEEVTSLKQAKELEKNWERISKLTNKPFEYWENRILVEPKAPEPLEWLDVEGVVPPGEVGATKIYPGVFSIIDKGRLYFGAVKPYYIEMFLQGKRFTGRWVIRKIPNPWGEHPAFVWFIMKPKDQMPYVLSKRAVTKKWMPPRGISALPPEIRRQIPREYRYWMVDDTKKAREIRDKLVEAIRKGEVKITIPKKWLGSRNEFVLQYQWWRGPIIIRRGPSRQQWLLWMDDECYSLDADPTMGEVTATLLENVPSEYRDYGKKEPQEVEPGTPLNPTKKTPSFIAVIDHGSYEVIDDEPLFRKIRFNGKLLDGLYVMERENPNTDLWILRRTETINNSS
ncbi:MAG: hypothetical protein DRN14_04615 [Thermoplasmata archaeon]|nr:MAG: hypothetical protein DRN14_04615 [Thermoplasmata archaeon]